MVITGEWMTIDGDYGRVEDRRRRGVDSACDDDKSETKSGTVHS